MKVGTLCYATDQGLGILAKAFYDHGVITDVMVVRHKYHKTHDEWYPDAPQTPLAIDRVAAHKFCQAMNAMLFIETPFDWGLIPFCRQCGVKTVLMPMYECMPHPLPYVPDLIINPSHLDQECYPQGIHIPVPVEVPWRLRTKAERFVHNAGHLGLKGRNGTLELLQAMKHVNNPIQLLVRAQTREANSVIEQSPEVKTDSRVTIQISGVAYEDLWTEGDVFVFPEKFNGLSLPLQEACAAGMLVMANDRFPMDQWLPREPLIPVDSYRDMQVLSRFRSCKEAIVTPEAIAATIDKWYGKDITYYSELGKTYAEHNSWERLKPRYLEALGR